jgi:large subunit ribosomal protein LP2
MRHIAAYAMLVLGGNEEPTAADIAKVLKEAGVAADEDKSNALCEALKGKPFHTLVEEGKAALSKMGGSAPAAAAAGGAAAAEKVEEKVEEEPEEDVDMGGLFGDDDDY